MNKTIYSLLVVTLVAGVNVCAADDAQHPNLILTAEAVQLIREQGQEYPKFVQTVNEVKRKIDARLKQPIKVPVPRDAGGGFTHEQHKLNYQTLYHLGMLYQFGGNKAYAERGKDILLAYAELYPTLGEHPQKKEQSPGRLFWQSLNESVWLVHVIQAYDALIATIGRDDRQQIEQNLLLPVADFLSEQSPQTFDKIHNHGTWAVAGVGMTGYVLDKPELVKKALYGLDKSGKAGFLKQLDKLFSPDGYYNEGPYYQRYALMPFLLFAKAVDNNDAQLKIFEYRDGILLKAIYTAIQLSYNKLFFPINDAIKDKGIDTIELVHGVAIAYAKTTDNTLLSIAELQPQVSLSADGLAVAKGLHQQMQQPFPYQSLNLRDGPDGKQGALAIIRSSYEKGHQALVMKNTSQGKGHGHFDKLHWLFYDQGNEIVSDYGAARFLNVEAKYGGHYLPENKTWAKQTVAHNTLVVDETSHFNGKLQIAKKYAPEILLFEVKPEIRISSAQIDDTYDGLRMVRTMAMISVDGLDKPLILDVLRADGTKQRQYDLPLHYQGHLIEVNYPVDADAQQLKPLGKKNGYQHLWVKATGVAPSQTLPQLTWLNKKRFYTYSVLNTGNQEFFFTQLGANDPNFNLRAENSLIQRIGKAQEHTFVAILEPHGEYNPTAEYTLKSKSRIKDIKLHEKDDIDYIQVTLASGKQWGLGLSYKQDPKEQHKIGIDGSTRQWQGYYHFFME